MKKKKTGSIERARIANELPPSETHRDKAVMPATLVHQERNNTVERALRPSECLAWLNDWKSETFIPLHKRRPSDHTRDSQAFPDDPILSIQLSSCFWILIVPSSITCVSGILPVFSAMYLL